MLHRENTIDYLLLFPDEDSSSRGRFEWTTNRTVAIENADRNYPNTEGIDAYQGRLYFVCKGMKAMFELDLNSGSYRREDTDDGLFDGEPDQVHRLLGNGFDDYLFFTEEGGSDAGIHGRDANGMFFTLLEGTDWSDETTGLAFSPDGRHLYVAYQDEGVLFDITRQDGFEFSATDINLKSHAVPSKQ